MEIPIVVGERLSSLNGGVRGFMGFDFLDFDEPTGRGLTPRDGRLAKIRMGTLTGQDGGEASPKGRQHMLTIPHINTAKRVLEGGPKSEMLPREGSLGDGRGNAAVHGSQNSTSWVDLDKGPARAAEGT